MVRSYALLLIGLFIFIRPAIASSSSADTAGAENSRFQAQQNDQKLARSFSQKVFGEVIDQSDEKIIEPAAQGPFFLINQIRVTGNASIPEKDFQPFFQSVINKEVSLQVLREKASEMKLYYRKRGFAAAYVYIPPQKIEKGIVEFRVIEGTLGQIQVSGNRWFSEKVIRRHLRSRPGRVLRFDTLRSDMNRLNQHRDIDARAVLKEGAEAQSADLEIKVADKFPGHIGASVNNQGTDNTGKLRTGIQASYTNLFGQMIEAAGNFQIGAGVWGVGGSLDWTLPLTDTRFDFSYLRSSVKVGGDFRALNISGHADTYSFSATQPLFLNDFFMTSAVLGFDWKSALNKVLGSVSSRDEFRIFRPGWNWSLKDPLGITLSTNSFNFGFCDFLGVSRKRDSSATRSNSGGQFFVYRGSWIRNQPLFKGIAASFRSFLQLSPDRLAPSEQMQLGGALSVRGYPESEFLADSAGYFNVEITVPTYIFPEKWKLPYSQKPLRQQIQSAYFFDYGGGWNRNVEAGETGSRTLGGIGLGLRIHLTDQLTARLDWAVPTMNRIAGDSSHAFYFGVQGEL